MKTSVRLFALIGALLLAGPVLAQAAPQPHSGPSRTTGPRSAVTSVSIGGQLGSETGDARATANPSGGPIDIESWSWGRIDRVNTVQACAARGGVVVMHEGTQQCRLPVTPRR